MKMHNTYVIKMQSERNVWNLPGNWDGWTRWRWNFCAWSVVIGSGDNEDDWQSFCLLPSGNQRKTPSFSFMMRTLAEFNGIHDPKINLTQFCWDLNELITMEDLLQGNKTINQLDHNAYTWRRAKEV
jgi:hypothetical protein